MKLLDLVFPSEAERLARTGSPLLALRLFAGVGLMLHGRSKIQNPFGWMGPEAVTPGVFQALAAVAEFFGGLAWVLGLLTPIASLGVLCTMLVAIATHLGRGDPFVGKGGWELASLYATIAVLFGAGGPGRFSVDAWLGRAVRGSEPGAPQS
ncbi:MAG: DoxX family protein [Candidatus Sericytochromatia bacterium]|nr:DoxX family protein [Candidatus Tanganyikabacteria bacterium]